MSFQAYLDTVQSKTGMDAARLKDAADAKGFSEGGVLKPETKNAQVLEWAKGEFGLGHGHAQAIWALLKGIRKPGD